MKLTDHHVSDKGRHVHHLRARRRGETGTFATKEPSKAELELRERIKEGAW